MFIPLTHNHILAVTKRGIHILPVYFLQIIRHPFSVFICLINIHQRIVRRPPESKKRSAFAAHHQISQIILCPECKILIQHPAFIQFMQITQSISGLFCHRSIDNLSILVDPFAGACPKFVKNRINGIAGTGTSHQVCITDKADRLLSFCCSHPVLYKCLHDIKGIFQSLWLFKPQLVYPVFAEPHQTRSMICDRLRDSHQLSVKFHRLQKTASIAFEHFLDPFGGTVLIHLRQILNQIVFYEFLEHIPV